MLLSGLGYLIYVYDKRMLSVAFCLSWQSDNGGLFFGNAFGKTAVDKNISPKKTVEGLLGAIILP